MINHQFNKINSLFDIHVKWWTLQFNCCNEYLCYSWWSHFLKSKRNCIKIAVHLLIIERKSHHWINFHEYRCRINIHLSYKLKKHFSNAFLFWRLDNELINQREHRSDDVNLWFHWIRIHSWTRAAWSSNEACLLFNSNEAHRFIWLLHTVFFNTSVSSLQNSWYHELMHVNVSLLSYVSDHLFLHDSRLIFKIDYEIIFSDLEDLSRSIFESKLRSKRWVIHKEVLLNIVYSGRTTMNLFSDCRRSSMK